ncbi:MAG: thioesterase II family protein [Longimicrobiaceae bacterium]
MTTTTPPTKDPWIQRPQPRPGARLRLLMIPHAGGGASSFRGWADALPPGIEGCPVQLPGRENRMGEPPFERLQPLVEALAAALERWRDLPYAVLGHSNGALIGFELARHARRTGAPVPVHLFASGRRAPHLPSRTRDVHRLPQDELVAELAELGGMPPQILEHPELMALLVPLLRADMALTETYVHADEPPLDLPITALTGTEDAKVSIGDAGAWGDHTSAGFRLYEFPGDHFYLYSARQQVIATILSALQAP